MTPTTARKAFHAHESAICQATRTIIAAAGLGTPKLPGALEKLQEVIASAPFHLNELEALGFRLT